MPKLRPMKGLPIRLLSPTVVVSFIVSVMAGAALVARSAQGAAPALAADAALPPSTAAFSSAGIDLAGRVVSEEGKPISGARVFIDAAKPRVGRGYT